MSDIQIPHAGKRTVHAHEFDLSGLPTTGTLAWSSLDAHVFSVQGLAADTQSASIELEGTAPIGATAYLRLSADNGVSKNFLVEVTAPPVASISITED